MSPFFQKKHKMHPSTKKSVLINSLQGLASLRLDRQHYTHYTIQELARELERARESQINGVEYDFVYRKEKPPKNTI
ncbi:hypothetical protein HGA34_00450 [Candidatus Falkowbacteria bacterium]|nr:hypothetical protein [Candidatus Falkowbacteria bacterium]